MPHTPGPWTYYVLSGDAKGKYPDKCRSFTIESTTRKHMFDTQAWARDDDQEVWEEVEANSRLIAVAPELLLVLKGMTKEFKRLSETYEPDEPGAEWLAHAHEIITKAEKGA